jgi:hypothetical protein
VSTAFVPLDKDVTRIALADQATQRNSIRMFGKTVPSRNRNLAKQTQSSLLAQAQDNDKINKSRRTAGK